MPKPGKQTTSSLQVFVFPIPPVVRLLVDDQLLLNVGVTGSVWYLVGSNLIGASLLEVLVLVLELPALEDSTLGLVLPSYKV